MALSKPIGDVIAEELECSICLDRLKSPRMLSCLHSFCEHCLQECADQSMDRFLHCPTCREQTVIPNIGIPGLKTDFRANKLLEALNKDETTKHVATTKQNCSLCKSSEACLICEECDLTMCQECAEFHPKMPLCRNHQVIPLMNRSSQKVNVDTGVVIPKCQRHDERLKFYCKSCKICICADCTVLDHSKVDGHECVYLKEIVPQFRHDVEELLVQVAVKAKDLDSLFTKIIATKQELDRKSSDVEREIGTEVARIKTILLDQNHDYIEKNRETIAGIEHRNRVAEKTVQDVSRLLQQVASSKDDLEVAEMHQSLFESVGKIMGFESDTTTLDDLQTKFQNVKLKCTPNDSSLHSSLYLVQQRRVIEQQNVAHATKYYAVGKKGDDTLSVIYTTRRGHLFCHDVQRHSELALPSLANRPVFRGKVRHHGHGFASVGTVANMKNFRCPYDVLPSGQICYVKGDILYTGSTPLTLYDLHQKKDNTSDDNVHPGPAVAVNTKGHIYVATAGLDYLLEIAPNNTILISKPMGNILPFAITTCNTSPNETIFIAHKPASVSFIDIQQNIRCIFSDMEGLIWQNAALACGHDGRVYLLSSHKSKVTLQILDKDGNLHETIFRDRPVSSQNPSPPKQTATTSGFTFGSAPISGSVYGSSLSASSPSSQEELGPRLSIDVASNGDIAAVLGEDEFVLITMQEIDVRKA